MASAPTTNPSMPWRRRPPFEKRKEPWSTVKHDGFAIHKVPEYILENHKGAYRPRVVSIGPYHLKSSSNLEVIQQHKHHNVQYLFSRCYCDGLWERCIMEMKVYEPRVRSFYVEEELGLSSDELAEMLVLDGCFIIHLLLWKAYSADDEDVEHIEAPLPGNQWAMHQTVLCDLLLHENQIPFFVVHKLFDLVRTSEGDHNVSLEYLAVKLFSSVNPPGNTDYLLLNEVQKGHHLLHIYHMSLLPHHRQDIPVPYRSTTCDDQAESIPSAMELHEAGVRLMMKKNTTTFLDIEFSKGVMQIPALQISRFTNSIFRNIIAFEQCYTASGGYVTAYAKFMNYLIRTTADMRLVHLNGIMTDSTSTDEEATCFFNSLVRKVEFSSDKNYLQGLYNEVSGYHRSKWKRWKATVGRNYCNNPCVMISVLTTTAILVMTFMQSFFTIYSSFHPPK